MIATSTASTKHGPTDPFDGNLAHLADGLLRQFNEAGVLDVADVQIARRLAEIGGEENEQVMLATAFAARAPRLGHVCCDLGSIALSAATVDSEEPLDLPWPDPPLWAEAVSSSPLCAEGGPLVLEGTLLYLRRYHAEECRVATQFLARATASGSGEDSGLAEELAASLFPGEADSLQRLACETALRGRLAVIAGGPGTGKTTTVARLLVAIDRHARSLGRRQPLIALSAPTGKAAARLEESVAQELDRIGHALSVERSRAMTLHRLLGVLPDTTTRFRHDASNPLPFDVVVVDEASMLSLSLMDRLLAAVRPEARLVLLGDPAQLASVEAGVVLGDLVGPKAGPGGPADPPSDEAPGVSQDGPMAGAIVSLQVGHRFGGPIAELAAAVRGGDSKAAMELLAAGHPELDWVRSDASELDEPDLAALRSRAWQAWREVLDAAAAGRGEEALGGLGRFRILCTNRRGPAGASAWSARVEQWLAKKRRDLGGRWYWGQPLLVTENDYDLHLFNGDTGVVTATGDGRLVALFDRQGHTLAVSPARLARVETCYAMTIHKAQGSQFDAVAVVLSKPGSPLLTRELLYTALTRARSHVTIIGHPASVCAAIERPIARSSGLEARLWGGGKGRGGPPWGAGWDDRRVL